MGRYQLAKFVEAVQFTGDNGSELEYFMQESPKSLIYIPAYSQYQVVTARGVQPLVPGEYVLRDLDGVYHIYNQYEFNDRFERID